MDEVKNFIGKNIDVMDDGGNIIKTVQVAKAKQTEYGQVIVDTDGNIYTEDELNMTYIMTPACALHRFLIAHGLLKADDEFIYDKYEGLFEDLMEMLEHQGIVEKTLND